MSRRVLQAAKCSQMSNAASGTGSGGNRCTEAVAAMLDVTYQLGPKARSGASAESIMYDFTEYLNQGRDTSAPLDIGVWFPAWLRAHGITSIALTSTTWPGYQAIVDCINRGHLAIGRFDDYVNLRLVTGGNPYQWNDPHGLSHVLLIVGYDTAKQAVVVHDPLRADPGGQPAEYAWSSFQAAKFVQMFEVRGPVVPMLEGDAMVPKGPFVSYTFGEEIPPDVGWKQLAEQYGLAEADFLAIPGNAVFRTYDGNPASVRGMVVRLPGYPQQAQPTLDLAALKADVAKLAALLAPFLAAGQAVQDLEKRLGG